MSEEDVNAVAAEAAAEEPAEKAAAPRTAPSVERKASARKAKPAAKPSFEKSLNDLENLVARMESGTLSLDDMVKDFEKGRELVKFCTEELDGIRRRIEKVSSASPGGVEPLELGKD